MGGYESTDSPDTRFTSTIGVPFSISRGPTLGRFPAIRGIRKRRRPSVFGLCGERFGKTPERRALWSPRECTFFQIAHGRGEVPSKDGSKIHSRGAAEVNNRLGLNCFACHVKAKPEFDFICEQTNGCDPIPVTRPMFTALQRSDPRCKDAPELTDEDKQALSDLAEVVKTLTQKQ